MVFKRFHETRKEANKALNQLKKTDPFKAREFSIWDLSKTFGNRKRKFFIGNEIEWLNI